MSESGDDGNPKRPAKSGDVHHDARGNAVWRWAVDTGRHAVDSTSRLLKRLEVPGLRIEGDTDDPPATPGDAPAGRSTGKPAAGSARPGGKAPRGAGYDPYGGGGARGGRGPGGVKAPAREPPAPARKPVAAAAPRRSLWQRLLRRS